MADDKYLALLPRLQEGDRQAFSELVSSLHSNMRSIARSMLSNGEAEEAVQDAWISVYKNITKFEGRSSLKTWITRIVINESRMRLRRHGREINLDISADEQDALTDRFRSNGHWQQAPVAWDFATPDQILEEQDLRRCMEKSLSQMPPQQRLVMELRDMQGLSFEDICNMLEISASNARVLLHRARAQLFTMVEHYQETGEC